MTQGGNEEKWGGRLIVGLDYTLSYLLAFHPSSENLFETLPSLHGLSFMKTAGQLLNAQCGQEVKEDN